MTRSALSIQASVDDARSVIHMGKRLKKGEPNVPDPNQSPNQNPNQRVAQDSGLRVYDVSSFFWLFVPYVFPVVQSYNSNKVCIKLRVSSSLITQPYEDPANF